MVKEEREKADQRVERFKRQNHRIMTGKWPARHACSMCPAASCKGYMTDPHLGTGKSLLTLVW